MPASRARRVHDGELGLDVLRASPLIHVVDPRDDHDDGRPSRHDIVVEARADLIAPLTVDALIDDVPVGVGFHQPVGILAGLVTAAVRR